MTPAPTADNGPGFLAFVAFFALALILWFLMRNMNARMRRMSYRQRQAHRGKDDPQAGPDEAYAGEPRDERDTSVGGAGAPGPQASTTGEPPGDDRSPGRTDPTGPPDVRP